MSKPQSINANPIAHWFKCHFRALLFSMGELVRTPLASIMTLAVIGLAMALPSGLFILLKHFEGLSHRLCRN